MGNQNFDCSNICKFRQKEKKQEFEYFQNYINNGSDPNNINNQIEKVCGIDKSKFKEKFDTFLQDFGKYINDNDFNDIISDKILKKVKNEPLNLPEEFVIDNNNYENNPIEFSNGNIYKGQWNDDIELDGRGMYYLPNDKVVVDGYWKKGELQYGRIFLPNNELYEGEIKNSLFNGKGKLTQKTGEVYEGNFQNGQKMGEGTITFPDGTIYHGNVYNGIFNGKGSMNWPDGIGYEGLFSGSKLHGKGVLTSNFGERYEGDFVNNKFDGKGIHTYVDGSIYEGEFKNGKKCGKGKYTSDSFTYKGEWSDDKPEGRGKITYNNTIVKCVFKKGLLIEKICDENDVDEIPEKILYFKLPKSYLNSNKLSHLSSPALDSNNIQYNINVGASTSCFED